jgi:TM2 domain-containing membrane protein YozV
MATNTILAKQGMTGEQLAMVQSEVNNKQKSKGTAYLLWFFFGGLGGHRFYMGHIGYAIGMVLTLGGLGLWTLIDLFLIGSAIEKDNEKVEMDAIQLVKTYSKKEA